jgi:hypothetical protein
VRRAELAVAAAWFALGAVIALASLRMDRLDGQGIEPWSAPGLTPGVVGVLVMVFALAVAWRAWRAPTLSQDGPGPAESAEAPSGLGRTAVAAALCLAFAATLGRGLPLIATGAAFVFAFTAVFSWRDWGRTGRIGRGLAMALAVAVASTLAIALLFERVFLVNLP